MIDLITQWSLNMARKNASAVTEPAVATPAFDMAALAALVQQAVAAQMTAVAPPAPTAPVAPGVAVPAAPVAPAEPSIRLDAFKAALGNNQHAQKLEELAAEARKRQESQSTFIDKCRIMVAVVWPKDRPCTLETWRAVRHIYASYDTQGLLIADKKARGVANTGGNYANRILAECYRAIHGALPNAGDARATGGTKGDTIDKVRKGFVHDNIALHEKLERVKALGTKIDADTLRLCIEAADAMNKACTALKTLSGK